MALTLQDDLNQKFGFSVPKPIVALMAQIIAIADEKGTTDFDKTMAGLMFSGYFSHYLWLRSDPQTTIDWSQHSTGRYTYTPVEFFPVFTAGIDGISWGPLVHAPELQLADYSWAEYSPMDHGTDRCCFLGQDSIEALEQILSEKLDLIENCPDENYTWDDHDREALIHRLSASLNLQVSATKARNFHQWKSRPIVPFIPPNWRFIPTSDGVGVLAPADRFHSDSQGLKLVGSIDECHELVQCYLGSDHPATALAMIREFYFQEMPDLEPIAADWIEIYERLDRSTLSREIYRGVQDERHLKEVSSHDISEPLETILIRYRDQDVEPTTDMSLTEFLFNNPNP